MKGCEPLTKALPGAHKPWKVENHWQRQWSGQS